MDRLSPFPAGAVYFDFRVGNAAGEPNRASLDLAILPRIYLEAWLDWLREKGMRVLSVRAEDAWRESNLLPPEDLPRPTLRQVAVNFSLVALVLGLAGLALQVPVWKSQEMLKRLSAQAQGLRVEAAEVQDLHQDAERLVETVARLGEIRSSARPVVDVVLELTNLLSDDSWVRSLEINGGEVLLCGESRDPAALLVRLEKSPMFSRVELRSPVVSIEGTPYQRFQLSAGLAVPRVAHDWVL